MQNRSRALAMVAATLLITTVLPAAVLAGATSTADPSTATAAADRVKVIVTFQGRAGPSDAAAIEAAGGTVDQVFSLIPAISVTVPANAITGLQNIPGVVRIEPDVSVSIFTDPELSNSWGVAQIGAGTTHSDPAGSTGAGVKIAVIDSGIASTHPDLDANYAGGANFIAGSPNPFDDNGHGSHVAGIIAAEIGNAAETQAALGSDGVVGVAPSASLYALKVVDSSGNGDYSDVIAALQWAVANDMDVVNISLGAHVDTQALHDAISATYNAGIVVVAASGNVNLGSWDEILHGCPVAFPAAYPEAIAVSFTDTSNGLTGLSCTGPEVFLAAPGDNVLSSVPTGSCMFCSSSGYTYETGTSMASPHVAGVAALILSHGIADTNGNGRTNDEVAAQLCATATPGDPGSGPDPAYPSHYGCGVVNAYNAIVAQPFAGTGAPPTAAFTAPATGNTVISASGTNTFTWTEDPAGSGVRSRLLTQEAGPVVTPGTCAGVSWATRWTASYTSPFTTGGYQTNTCYRYTLNLVNGAGGSGSASSGNLLVSLPAPPSPSATFTSPALGSTVTTTNTTNTVTWTESDGGGGGITVRKLTQQAGPVVTPGTCAGVAWVTRWTGSYSSPFTTGGYQAGTCYRYTLNLTNGAGGTATASSGDLLVSAPTPPPSPSATFTSPALGSTVTSTATTNTVTWTESDGGGNGITSRKLTQQSGPVVTPGTCSGVTWTTRWTGTYSSPFTTTGYQVGYCYRYTLLLTNGAGGTATASSGNLLINAPPSPTGTFTSPALGDTVSTASTTNTVTWTESDGGGNGITSRKLTQQSGPIVTPGTCAGVTWTTRWTATYSSPFTTGGYQVGTCYRYTLTLTNGAGGTSTASSGNLLINPPPSPSATFTSPALGDTVISTSATNTFTWTESDGGGGAITSRNLTQQSGPVVTPGTCAGVTWATGWTKTFTSPFTTGGYKAGYCYRYTLKLTNAAGGTATASSGSLLVDKKN